MIHIAESAHTDCEPNDNVEALRVGLDAMNVEARPVWKPMHCQPVYRRGKVESSEMIVESQLNDNSSKSIICQTSESSVAYINGVSEGHLQGGYVPACRAVCEG